MGAVVLDASVVLALVDPADRLHVSSVTAVRRYRAERATWVLPASAFAEVLVGAARQGQASLRSRRQQLIDAFGPPRPIDAEVATEAARLRAQHRGLRLPDAFVLAVGRVDGAAAILTGDQRWQPVDRRVEVVAPG